MTPEDGLGPHERQQLVQRALADWSPAAGARVHSLVATGRRAAVNLILNGDYEYSEYFQRDEYGRWAEAGSSSGHAVAGQLELQLR